MSLTAKSLLVKSAQAHRALQEGISSGEIKKRIEEIKYLSAQKSIPRLSLRKEVLHLEQKLDSLVDVEKRLLKKEQQESQKIQALKKQISTLKDRMHHSNDVQLRQKVSKLAHILAEHLAQVETTRSVALRKRLLALERQRLQQNTSKKGAASTTHPLVKVSSSKALAAKTSSLPLQSTALTHEKHHRKPVAHSSRPKVHRMRLTTLHHRLLAVMCKLDVLEQELERHRQIGLAGTTKSRRLQDKIDLLKDKLFALREQFPQMFIEIDHELSLQQVSPQALLDQEQSPTEQIDESEEVVQGSVEEPLQVKHRMLFQAAPSANSLTSTMPLQQLHPVVQKSLDSLAQESTDHALEDELISELPLPPPPKISRRGKNK